MAGPTQKIVLIVEDTEILRFLLKTVLLKHGFMVLEATGGIQALNLIKTYKVDFLISDLEMHEGDGISLLAALKGQGTKIKTLVLTGNTESSLAHYQRLGADELLHKPYSEEVLNKILEFLKS